MHKYRVIERTGENRLVLEGGVGRYHWARALNEPPRVGAFLSGSRPHLGFGLLQCGRSALIYRVIFETINGVDPGFDTGRIAAPSSTSPPGRRPPGHEWHARGPRSGPSDSESRARGLSTRVR